MTNLSDFKSDQIIGARMAGATVTKTAELFSVASSVSKAMTAFERKGKTCSLKQNSRRKQKLSDMNRRTRTQIVRKNHKNTKITAELNDHLETPVSSEKKRKELHKVRFYKRAAIRKPY